MELYLIASFIIYLGLLLAASLYSSWGHKQEGQSFLLGGRSLNYWVTAISAHAADMSDWLFMGFPAAVYLNGVPSLWIAISLVLGMYLTWQFIAPRLRADTECYDAYTLTSYFERRFNDTSDLIRIASAIMIAFFFTIYLAAGVKGVGLLLKAVFDIPYHVGGLLGIGVVIIYTVIGGFVAAGWAELFQGLFLLAMLLVTAFCAFISVGGTTAIIDAAHINNIPLTLLPDYSLNTVLSILAGPLAWGLGYFGMPHVLIKFCGAANTQELYKSKYIGMVWQILAFVAAASIGIVGIAFFAHAPLAKPELIFIEITQSLFNPFFAGFVLCGFLSATLSTMDAQILVLAGIVAEEFKVRYPRSSTYMLAVYRAAIVVISLCAYFIAYDENSTVFGLVQYAWSGLGASFGPVVIYALYSKTVNKYGAFAGIVSGGLCSALWKNFIGTIHGVQVNELIPGFFVGLIVAYCVSLMTKTSD